MSREEVILVASKSPSTLSSSDYGERQERGASVGGSTYWESPTRPSQVIL